MESSPEEKTAVMTDNFGEDLRSLELAKSLRPSVCCFMPVRAGSSTKNNQKLGFSIAWTPLKVGLVSKSVPVAA